MKRIILSILAVLALSYLLACAKKEEHSPAKMARVSATKAYEKYFGPAPTTDKGTCYAFVIYFPSAKESGKLVPFPFFSFDEGSLQKVAIQRLVEGMADLKAYQGEILQPFPKGTRLLEINDKEGIVTVNFSNEIVSRAPDDVVEHALANALVMTLRQFKGVREVQIRVDGKESRLSRRMAAGEDSVVIEPSKPRVLSVTAMKEKGAKDVEEVNAFFDRPVDIKVLQMQGADGKPFQGDVYQSVFDMAGVLKPKDPAVFKAGMPIRVRWKVTDKLGRNAAGEAEFPLEIKEH